MGIVFEDGSFFRVIIRERVEGVVDKMTKQEARKWIKDQYQTLSVDYKKRANEDIQNQVLHMESYQQAKTIFCYVNMEHEVSTRIILEHALEEGKRVGVPLCYGKGIMDVREIKSLEDLEPGLWGILEPKKDLPVINQDEIDFGVIPCVSASLDGKRLGHGAGYYDRYLEGTAFEKVLVCFGKLILDNIPVDEYDVMMDQVICERRNQG